MRWRHPKKRRDNENHCNFETILKKSYILKIYYNTLLYWSWFLNFHIFLRFKVWAVLSMPTRTLRLWIIVLLLFTRDRRFISIHVLPLIFIIFVLLLWTADRFVAVDRAPSGLLLFYVAAGYTVNIFVLPELFAIARIQSIYVPLALKPLRRIKPSTRRIARLGRRPHANRRHSVGFVPALSARPLLRHRGC